MASVLSLLCDKPRVVQRIKKKVEDTCEWRLEHHIDELRRTAPGPLGLFSCKDLDQEMGRDVKEAAAAYPKQLSRAQNRKNMLYIIKQYRKHIKILYKK